MKTLVTYEHWGKKFSSQERLNDFYLQGYLTLKKTERSDNGFVYGHWYEFYTLTGERVAKFYKDNTFGFCSQATGVVLECVPVFEYDNDPDYVNGMLEAERELSELD